MEFSRRKDTQATSSEAREEVFDVENRRGGNERLSKLVPALQRGDLRADRKPLRPLSLGGENRQDGICPGSTSLFMPNLQKKRKMSVIKGKSLFEDKLSPKSNKIGHDNPEHFGCASNNIMVPDGGLLLSPPLSNKCTDYKKDDSDEDSVLLNEDHILKPQELFMASSANEEGDVNNDDDGDNFTKSSISTDQLPPPMCAQPEPRAVQLPSGFERHRSILDEESKFDDDRGPPVQPALQLCEYNTQVEEDVVSDASTASQSELRRSQETTRHGIMNDATSGLIRAGSSFVLNNDTDESDSGHTDCSMGCMATDSTATVVDDLDDWGFDL